MISGSLYCSSPFLHIIRKAWFSFCSPWRQHHLQQSDLFSLQCSACGALELSSSNLNLNTRHAVGLGLVFRRLAQTAAKMLVSSFTLKLLETRAVGFCGHETCIARRRGTATKACTGARKLLVEYPQRGPQTGFYFCVSRFRGLLLGKSSDNSTSAKVVRFSYKRPPPVLLYSIPRIYSLKRWPRYDI